MTKVPEWAKTALIKEIQRLKDFQRYLDDMNEEEWKEFQERVMKYDKEEKTLEFTMVTPEFMECVQESENFNEFGMCVLKEKK